MLSLYDNMRRRIATTGIEGFTLVELSIVLVIIGLIVGGILTGQELIRTAEVRSTITQIEKYQTAVGTFYTKYGTFPGDINNLAAIRYGFLGRGQYAGEGDGNQLIEGVYSDGSGHNGAYQEEGETCMFWVDLSTARLIDSTFTSCNPTLGIVPYNQANIDLFFPTAKIGKGNHIYVWSWQVLGENNWFSISAGLPETSTSKTGLTVNAAFQIDKKIDDGLPQYGNVNTWYLQDAAQVYWSGTTYNNVNLTATPGTSSTCFDDGNAGGIAKTYSINQNGGRGVNCALSFQFTQ